MRTRADTFTVASVKVRKRTRTLPSGTKKVRWECDLGKINGKRVAIWFATKKEADERLEKEKEKVKQFGHSAYSLTEAERHRFTAARERLAAAGASIEQAVDFYLAEHRALRAPIALGELLDAFVLAKELAGRRERYVTQLGVSCRSFIRGREKTLVTEVRREDVARWITGNGWAPKTQQVYLGDLRALFSWALEDEQRYLAKNPASGKFPLARIEDEEIEALNVGQVKRLLTLAAQIPVGEMAGRKRGWNRPPLLWYVVLGLFCGIRPDELARMDRSMVSIEERHAIVPARKAKTRKRRVVDIAENAAVWLALDPLRTGPIRPKNFRLLFGRLRFAAGFIERNHTRANERPDETGHVEWAHDVMRHTFASMHYAQHQKENVLKAQMGHSKDEDTLMQHYRALKTRREAEEFWGLRPENDE